MHHWLKFQIRSESVFPFQFGNKTRVKNRLFGSVNMVRAQTQLVLISSHHNEHRPIRMLRIAFPVPKIKTMFHLTAFIVMALTSASAHDSPEHVIDKLTEEMQARGETAPLLVRRAGQYRIMRRLEEAVTDLYMAIDLDPESNAAHVELIQIHLAQKKIDDALELLSDRLKNVKTEKNKGFLYLLKGDALVLKHKLDEALINYNRAIEIREKELNWYLRRSELQKRLGRHEERIKGLEYGRKRMNSYVLFTERIEAMIDGGRAKQALKEIIPQLEKSRLKSSWLIRRARARLALGEVEQARSDLELAVAEITNRLHPISPDPGLLLDRSLSFQLLGDQAAAVQDFQEAKQRGATEWQLKKSGIQRKRIE